MAEPVTPGDWEAAYRLRRCLSRWQGPSAWGSPAWNDACPAPWWRLEVEAEEALMGMGMLADG